MVLLMFAGSHYFTTALGHGFRDPLLSPIGGLGYGRNPNIHPNIL